MPGWGVSSDARVDSCYLGSVTVSGTTALVAETIDALALPFKPVAVLWQVTTGVTVAAAVMTLMWEADPAGGVTVPIATWSQPVASADTVGYVSFNKNDDTAGTQITAASPAGSGGIAGSFLFTGEEPMICGPGGAVNLVSNGGASAGAVNYWLIYESLGFDQQQQSITRTAAATVS